VNWFRSSVTRIGVVFEFWSFMRVRKKRWLGSSQLLLLSLGFLAVFTQSSALAPSIATLF
jgi:drug/metabolite transporter superfamily protein YnfA